MDTAGNELITSIEQETIIAKKYDLSLGKAVKDVIKKDDYIIKEIRKDGMLLQHIPFFASEQKADLFIGYTELIRGFEAARLIMEGFSEFPEGSSIPNQNIPELKRAIRDVIKEIERQRIEGERQAKEEELAAKARELEEEKKKLEDEKRKREEKMLKIKAKKRAKEVRLYEEERQRQIAEMERYAREKEKNHRILVAKRNSQQQRLRLIFRKDF